MKKKQEFISKNSNKGMKQYFYISKEGIIYEASIYIWRNGLKTGVGGHITGVNRKDVLELSKLFAAKVGAKIGKLYIKK